MSKCDKNKSGMRGAAKCVIDVTVCHWCHPVMMSLSLCHCDHWCHCVIDVTVSLMSLCHWCHYVIDVTVSLMSLCHWCYCITDVTMSAAPYKSLFCSYILMSSVIYLSDEGLTLETSALKLLIFMLETYPLYYWTVAQLHAIDLLRVTWKWNNFFPFI